MSNLNDEQTQIRRHFIDFFERDGLEEKSSRRIHTMMTANQSRLILDTNDFADVILGRGSFRIGVERAIMEDALNNRSITRHMSTVLTTNNPINLGNSPLQLMDADLCP